jgi:hypothetical protein
MGILRMVLAFLRAFFASRADLAVQGAVFSETERYRGVTGSVIIIRR